MARAYLVYITAQDEQEAARIGRALVERRLAACATVVPGATSFYWWKGQLEEAREALLLVKTLEGALPVLEEAVRSLHSYEVPAVSAVPVERLHAPYLRWMEEEVRGGAGGPGAPGPS